MKDQLEALATEMISEIKNLKDLTKTEVPAIAREFIEYNIRMAVIEMAASAIGLMATAALAVGAFLATGDHAPFCLGVAAALVSPFGIIGAICSVSEYMRFKYQPRRMAIKAITSLLP